MKKAITLILLCLLFLQATSQCWQNISAGSDFTLAIKNDGTLWAWGHNNYGQLGDGTTLDKIVPTQIGSDHNWQKIATGEWFSLAIKSNGTLWAWGYNANGQLRIGTTTNSLSPVQVGKGNKAFGSNQVEVESGVWAKYTGDINQDGFVDSFDFPALGTDIFNGVSGVYVNTDLNGDGFVDSFDFPVFDVNSFNGVSIMTP